MKSAITFVLGFVATMLVLLGCSSVAPTPWIAIAYVLVCGAFLWFCLQAAGELFYERRLHLAKHLVPGIVLLILGLSWCFDIFPYAWNALVTLLLAGCVTWRGFRDYAELIGRRQKKHGPQDWQRLAAGNIPATSAAKVAAVKGKLTNSCVVHGKCVPRAGAMGLISQPLRMDE